MKHLLVNMIWLWEKITNKWSRINSFLLAIVLLPFKLVFDLTWIIFILIVFALLMLLSFIIGEYPNIRTCKRFKEINVLHNDSVENVKIDEDEEGENRTLQDILEEAIRNSKERAAQCEEAYKAMNENSEETDTENESE